VISATHVKLEDAVRKGTFRADLYHRLCVLRLVEPPLRARGRDIEIIAHHMLERFRADSPRRIRGFSEAAIRAMYSYQWPGNIRELINRVRRAIVMTEGRVITPADLELEQSVDDQACTLVDAREAAERHAIESALLRHRNRLNLVAQELGISRATLYRLMQTHGLSAKPQESLASGSVLATVVSDGIRPVDGGDVAAIRRPDLYVKPVEQDALQADQQLHTLIDYPEQ